MTDLLKTQKRIPLPPSIALAMGFRARMMRDVGFLPSFELRRECVCSACAGYYALLDGMVP